MFQILQRTNALPIVSNGFHKNPSIYYKSLKFRNFSTKPSGWRRKRFKRRVFLSALLFGTWYFAVDADFITYFAHLYRTKYQTVIHEHIVCNKQKKHSNLQNKTIWIIGASSGVGEHLAYNLSKLNAPPQRIILSARRINELNRVANTCNDINPMIDILVKPLDITEFTNGSKDTFVDDLFTEINDDIDILVLNSGILQQCRAVYASMDSFKQLADINLFGHIALAQSVIKQWRMRKYINKRKVHQIGVTSSFAGKMGTPGYAFYAATKHALNGFFESLRTEVMEDNIDFNICCFGAILPTDAGHDNMGGQKGINYRRRPKEVFGERTPSAARCAEYYVTALEYSLSECWIAHNPLLFYFYGRQYLPAITAFGQKLFGKQHVKELQRIDKSHL